MSTSNIERDPTGFHGDLAQQGRSHTGSASAFPFGQSEGVQPEYGLTKRELLAAMAMQGLLANSSGVAANADWKTIAEEAVSAADALLCALSDKAVQP